MSSLKQLFVVGIGPGSGQLLTPQAKAAIEQSRVVAGYDQYLSQIEPLLHGKQLISNGMTGEEQRCRLAMEQALEGQTVSVVSGGDAGIYGMASLVLELAQPFPELEVVVIPGVTSATAAAAILGAPLGHDFAVISLSDRLTDWNVIEQRLLLAAQADLVLCLYNPGSKARADYLAKAARLVLRHRTEMTPCGIVRDACRPKQQARILTLEELTREPGDMHMTVLIGSSKTVVINGRMVTPRGYPI